TMDVNGAEQKMVPAKQTGFGWIFPAWSPDSSRIAYADGEERMIDLWTCAADGTRRKAVTAIGGTNTFPAWSPDGKQVAFIHYDGRPEDGDGSLWITDPDGTVQSQVGKLGKSLTGRPAWRPRS